MTHSEAKNQTRPHTRPHTRSHLVRTVRILRPLASTPTHRGADGAAVCIPLWDRRVASKKWRCSARRPGRVEIHRTKGADRLDSVPPRWSTPLVCLLRPKDDSGGHERSGAPDELEVERLIKVAKGNCHGHRDALMILMACRHAQSAAPGARFLTGANEGGAR